ncbi:MAG: RNA methyltransferase [Lentisphaerae bacterium]|nr:RNA methyltransferase [Lentisphaerota bacterium]
MQDSLRITSLQNPRVKNAVKLRQRSHRDTEGRLLVEGYREILRALDNGHQLLELFYCPELFMGHNEQSILERARGAGTSLLECSEPVFRKIAYRDRPEGLLAIAPQIRRGLQDISLPQNPLVLVAESIEKPGNLGTILRTADAVGAAAVIVCDRCTDLNNPNVVRASIGTVFSVQVAEAGSAETLEWLKLNGIKVVCSTPHTDTTHTEADLSGPVAILLGSEQYGASKAWMEASDLQVRIPMMGQADSLNVASAAAVLLFEALRQRLTTSAKPSS